MILVFKQTLDKIQKNKDLFGYLLGYKGQNVQIVGCAKCQTGDSSKEAKRISLNLSGGRFISC